MFMENNLNSSMDNPYDIQVVRIQTISSPLQQLSQQHPTTVATSSIEGKISDPRRYF
jgi:hypothetical protein